MLRENTGELGRCFCLGFEVRRDHDPVKLNFGNILRNSHWLLRRDSLGNCIAMRVDCARHGGAERVMAVTNPCDWDHKECAAYETEVRDPARDTRSCARRAILRQARDPALCARFSRRSL